MVGAIIGGVVSGGLIVWLRLARVKQREAQRRERLAAIVVHAEMTAAIAALDLALRDPDAKWLVSMSESRTLSEAWRDHGEALLGLGSERWDALSDAVSAVAPSYRLPSVSARTGTEDLRRSLADRRRLLVEGARILDGAQGSGR